MCRYFGTRVEVSAVPRAAGLGGSALGQPVAAAFSNRRLWLPSGREQLAARIRLPQELEQEHVRNVNRRD